MALPQGEHTYVVAAEEKITSVMVYTRDMLVLGDVANKEAVRVSTWLRTASVPKYIYFHDANILSFNSGSQPKPQQFKDLHLPTAQVVAFHIKPPAHDPLDYDPQEPNRKMEAIIALAGPFRFEGYVRMSQQTSLEKFLEVAKEDFVSLYDVEIKMPSVPNIGVIHVPFALVRTDQVSFSPRMG